MSSIINLKVVIIMSSNNKSKNTNKNTNKNNTKNNNKTNSVSKNNKIENNSKPEIKKNDEIEKTFGMKVLVFLGVVISCGICIYLMNYFFVEKSYIKINISTDKKVDTIKINNQSKAILTQKYVSDLNYSMRYDIDNFKVFKYKKQDIFKFLNAEKILVIVEKGTTPKNCSTSDNEVYNSCMVTLDEYTKIYYVKENNNNTYKITVKTPNTSSNDRNIKSRIEYMLQSFEMKA